MTEFWVSQKMHWCEYCKCWLKDTPQSRSHHEAGLRHQQAVANRLAATKRSAAQEKLEHDMALKSMKDIECKAKEQYEKDLREGVLREGAQAEAQPVGPQLPRVQQAAAPKRDLKGWYLDKDSGYYYHDDVGWYYHEESGMYYGGDPPEWSKELPWEKRDKAFPTEEPGSSDAAPVGERVGGALLQEVAQKITVRRAEVKKHPLADIGGHKVPSKAMGGSYGGAKGVGPTGPGAAAREAALAGKRKRDEAQEAKLSQAEREARERREAAKARVAQRTQEYFGLA